MHAVIYIIHSYIYICRCNLFELPMQPMCSEPIVRVHVMTHALPHDYSQLALPDAALLMKVAGKSTCPHQYNKVAKDTCMCVLACNIEYTDPLKQ